MRLGEKYGDPLGEECDDPMGILVEGNCNDSVLLLSSSLLLVMVTSSSGGGHLVNSCTLNSTPLTCHD